MPCLPHAYWLAAQLCLIIKAYVTYLIWLKIDHAKLPWVAGGIHFKLLFVYGFDYQTDIKQ